MAKKKVVKKKVVRPSKTILKKEKVIDRKLQKSLSSKKIKIASSKKLRFFPQIKKRLALRDLILFAILSLISYILYTASGIQIYQDTFYLLSMIFGFIAVAFLIVFLVR